MNEYMTIKEAAEPWGLSPRWIQTLCASNKVDGAIKFGHAWAIPKETERPEDGRETTGRYKNWRKSKKNREVDISCHSDFL